MPKSPYVDFRAVKQAVTMVQILDHYQLSDRFQTKGDSLSGPCPLHDGQNPTQFRVSVSKNCWNCFGDCKRGGNILDFVSLKDDVSIREAAIRISQWFSLPLAKSSNGDKPNEEQKQKHPKPERSQSTPKRKEGSDETGPNKPLGFELQHLDAEHPYLAERGLSEETIAEFGLGYCAKGSMSGHVVIPIHNVDGKIVAYAGRWPGNPAEDTPKYKLPAGFRKSMELFNIHRAQDIVANRPLVIVEGFFDCFHLWQAGVKRVVALMGSQMSVAQQELIAQTTFPEDRIIVMLDEDDAGRAGREEVLQRLAPIAYVRVFRFEKEGQQPTDLSGEALRALIGGAT